MRTTSRCTVFVRCLAIPLGLMLTGCNEDLMADLSERQANEAIALLQRHHVDASKQAAGKKRFKVEVEKAHFAQAAELLRVYGLPIAEDAPISSLFPPDALVNSPTAERARLISGLEERLSQTINHVEGIYGARVHASYPVFSRDNGVEVPMHLAVMLNYEGTIADSILAEQLKQLARNSFEALSYDNISVVVFHSSRPEPPVVPAAPGNWPALLALLVFVIVLSGALGALFLRHRKHKALAAVDAAADSQ
jgi:type III secretion system YscJ/HrcJ family lipoprotein